MSAAPPVRPPYPNNGAPGAYSNGNGHGNGNGSARPSSSSSGSGAERAYAHIQDLQNKALEGFNRSGSVQQLLVEADTALSQAHTLLNFRRPDLSYVEYMRASEIVVEAIPRNKGWPDFQVDYHGGAMQKYHQLLKRTNTQVEQYAKIKDIIINNNRRSGVKPNTGADATGGHVRAQSIQQVNSSTTIGAAAGHKIKPAPSPKPDKLHGRAISTAGIATNGVNGISSAGRFEALNDRFARLRTAGPVSTDRPESRSSNPSMHDSPVSVSSTHDYNDRNSFERLSRLSSGPGPRPAGPRAMPAQPPPGKLPLDTSLASAMPKEPSPTYSPARNMQAQGNIALPRHTARSLVSQSNRRTTPTSSASSYAPNGNSAENGDYFPSQYAPTSNGQSSRSQLSRRTSTGVPKETCISTERLYDCLQRFNILLIDFRSREEFDEGHINSRNVMCIDPIHVTRDMSADQLQDRMVISPDIEQEMFMNRDQYDLVVYYDNRTQSESYLTRPNGEQQTKLKYLHETLDDFNHDKPLQHPPVLLSGGVEAWADLIGRQALMVSDTASKAKQGRPIQRRPIARTGNSSQLRNPKRRLRDYNPLDDEEERKWRERARAESVVLPPPTGFASEVARSVEEDGEPGEENAAIQEFLERFPEAGTLERHAFGSPQPVRSAPEPPPKLPVYPSRGPSASYTVPQPPAPLTRPPNTLPKTSYTGVSDRAASQNAPTTRSSSLAPYIPPKYLATNLRLPKTGLYNFRFTCYMNATLQALSATTPLSIFFLDDSFRGLLQRDNWKGTKGVAAELYSNLIRSMWKGDVNYIRPTTFRTFCGRLNSEWGRDDREQDAKEFFDFLVDCLHEDLNVTWSRTPHKELTPAEEARRERMPKAVVARHEWDRYIYRDWSCITSLFGGQYSSRLQCLTCGHTSTTYEAFYTLSVEIPRLRNRNPTLNDCLEAFCARETLSGNEQARCEKCHDFRDSTKQITLTRAPQFLVVHFKRFATSSSSGLTGSSARAQKINTPIDFPLENLDIEPYMLPTPTATQTSQILSAHGPDALRPDPAMSPPYTYDAYAVVRHLGPTLEEGHYKALVKDRARKTWRCFNDTQATDFVPGKGEYAGSGDVRNGMAYIVFYQRNLAAAAAGGVGVGKI